MRVLIAASLALFAGVLPLAGHAKHRAAPAEAPRIHRLEKVAEGVYCIFGQGGNIGLVITAKHGVLIDDQFERLVPGLAGMVTQGRFRHLGNAFHRRRGQGFRARRTTLI